MDSRQTFFETSRTDFAARESLTPRTDRGIPDAHDGGFQHGSEKRSGIEKRYGSEKLRFRYGYICRLIDDSELEDLPAALRSSTRSSHKEFYWKSLTLLRRDADLVLKLRREKMAAHGAWDFQSLVRDHARIQLLLAKLTLAGISHSVRLGAGLESAQQACLEFESFLASSAALTSSSGLAASAQ